MPTPPIKRTRSESGPPKLKRPALTGRIRRALGTLKTSGATFSIDIEYATLTKAEKRDMCGLADWCNRWIAYATGEGIQNGVLLNHQAPPPTPTLFEKDSDGKTNDDNNPF